jgi:hypothetical protein
MMNCVFFLGLGKNNIFYIFYFKTITLKLLKNIKEILI